MTRVATLLCLLLLCTAAASTAQNELLAPVDDAINAALNAAGAPNRDTTRVVPLVSASGVTRGYAQIVGARSRVAAARAVIQISSVAPNGWTMDMLVPVTTVGRTGGSIHRAYGVAVDAVVSGRI